jgi:hypothetical protein
MKTIYIFLILLVASFVVLQAQEGKLRIAVFDPSGSNNNVDEGTRVVVREIISSVFVNTDSYVMIERSLLDKVMKEQAFSNSGIVDDNQATELGKLAGANKIVLSSIAQTGNRSMLSIKMIDVQTATIEKQKAKVVSSIAFLDEIEPLTRSLLGEEIAENVNKPITSSYENDAQTSTYNADNTGSELFIGDVLAVKDGKTIGSLEKHIIKSKTKMGNVLLMGVLGSTKTKISIDGCCAKTVFKSYDNFQLIVTTGENRSDPMTKISIFKLEKNRKNRETDLSSKKVLGGSSKSKLDNVSFKAGKYGTDSYIITVTERVVGEYGIIVNNDESEGKDITVSTFAIEN